MKKPGGAPNYKGINNQSYAALSLFLQYVVRSDFVEILFEQDHLEDFVLVYDSGKRIICESKYRNNSLLASDLKKILDTVISNGQIKPKDELLIITETASDQVKNIVNNFKYFNELYREELKNKEPHFEEKHFKLLEQVKLWEVSQFKNREGILLLMSRVLSLDGPFWIPRDVIEDWINTLLVEGVYLNSQAKGKISRVDFLRAISDRKTNYLEHNGTTYEDAKKIELDKIQNVIRIVSSANKKDVCDNAITELVANPSLHYYLLQKLSQKKDLILKDWEALWLATIQGAYSIELFKTFENNLSSIDNQKYILGFTKVVLKQSAVSYFRGDFIKKDIVDICQKIYAINKDYSGEIISLIKRLYDYKASKYLYEERQGDDSWEREEISSLLKEIFDKTTDSKLRMEVVDYILTTFNLVEDDGKFWHYTPPQLFQVIQDYVKEDPEKRILWFTKIASEQYKKFYQRFGKKIVFEGWEHMGGGIGQSGSEFSISDKHFVVSVIEQALNSIVLEKRWTFMIKNLITTDPDKINADKPDFLNRACLSYLVSEYGKKPHFKDAFEILASFIKMRKGIPWKPDLIFQLVRNSELTPNGKWNLVKVSLVEYKGLPVNVFVEQIVTELTNNDSSGDVQEKAIKVLTNWASDPNYRKTRSLGSYDIVDSVFKLLNNPKTLSKGVEILRTYLNSDYFIQNTDTYGSWDIAKAIALLLQKEINSGIKILEEINTYKTLSVGQQLVLCGCFDDIPKENPELISLVVDRFLLPMFKKLGTIQKVEERFPHHHAREQIANFLDTLAEIGEYRKTLDLIKILINDSDPPRDGSNSPDDPKGEFNQHKQIEAGKEDNSINTVRGQVAWALRRFALLPAGEFIPEVIPLVKELSEDTNYYVRLQSAFPLEELAKNRDTYLPNKPIKERFVSAEDAKKIEDIAFSMLRDSTNQKLPAIMKALVHVFGNIRAVDDKRALEILNIFLKTNIDSVLNDVAPLLVFFSEFRKNAFKNWPWGTLPEFDDKPFKSLLEKEIKEGKQIIKHDLAWQFWRLPDEGKPSKDQYDRELFKTSVHYFEIFGKQEYSHDIWEHIYRFIEDYMEYEFYSCFILWKTCVEKERPYLTEAVKDKNSIPNIYWWPFFYNGKVLLAIYDHMGADEFLKWVDFMSDYPPEVYLAHDFSNVVTKLKQLPKNNALVGQIFDKLIKRNPSHYDDKQNWLDQ